MTTVKLDGQERELPRGQGVRYTAARQQLKATHGAGTPEYQAALRAATVYLLDHEHGLAEVAQGLVAARSSLGIAKAAAVAVARLAAEDRIAIEGTLADMFGVNRLTLRKWLGKQDRPLR